MKCFTMKDGGISPAIPLRRTEMGQVALDLLEVLIPLEREWGQRIEGLVREYQTEQPGFKPSLFTAALEPGYVLVPSDGSDKRALVAIRYGLKDRIVMPEVDAVGIDFDALLGVVPAGTNMVHYGEREALLVLTPGTGFMVEHTDARPGEVAMAELYYSFSGRLEVLRTEKARRQKDNRPVIKIERFFKEEVA